MEKQLINLPKTNPFVRWILSISLFLIFLASIISWTIWFLDDRQLIEDLLLAISNDLINIDFWTFSSIIFTFAGLSLIFAISLAVIKKKNTANNIISLLSLFLSLGLFGVGLFFNLYLINNPLFGDVFDFNKEHLIILIPYYIIMFLSLIVVISSLINLVVVKNKLKFKESKLSTKDLIKPIKINANNLKTNNLTTKTLATIKVTVPVSNSGNSKDITDNIRVYQNKNDVNLDLNISDN